MKKREQKDNSIKKYPWRRYAVMSGAVVGLALLTFVAARYRTFFKSGDGQMTGEEFYFTTDLLGNEAMVAKTGGESGQYQYEDVQKGEWHLYGGGEHEISINLRNYYDELRVTEGSIDYTASVNVLDKEGQPAADMNDLATLSIAGQSGNQNQTKTGANPTKSGAQKQTGSEDGTSAQAGKTVTGTLKADSQGKGVEQELLLQIISHEDVKYEEGTAVEVNIRSTKPYVKEMKLHFTLYKVDTYLSREIRDKENSPYAELIIMTNVVNSDESGSATGIQPYLKWSTDLAIDNTNRMTFEYKETDGQVTFTPVNGMDQNEIRIAKPLKAGESQSIYFFKSDTSKTYSKEPEIIEPNKDKNYVIKIGSE